MFFYFYSYSPAIIKINGVYNGKINDRFKRLFIDLLNPPFVEICFLYAKSLPLYFMLDKDFLLSPPDFVAITDLKGGYAITINEAQSSCPFTIINQQKHSFAVATVFKDNGLKLSIETPNDFYAQNIAFCCDSAEIIPFCLDNQQFLAINFLGEKNLLLCYLIDNKVTEVFSKTAVEFCFENGFTTTEKHLDIAKHKITCSWKFDGNKLLPMNTTTEKDCDFNINNLIDSVLPYAFLEDFMLGDNVQEYLSDSVKQNFQFLKEYLGEYIGVFPPPSFRKFDEVALLYKNGHNKYNVEYFNFEILNRKICNIKRSDN